MTAHVTATALSGARTQTVIPAVRWHAKALTGLDSIIAGIRADQWTLPTPCADWDVRALVAHLVAEARWTAPLLAGLTIDEVGTTLDGDLLGSDPGHAWAQAQAAAFDAARGPSIGENVVHLSAGATPAQEYLRQLTADYLVHGWDLAVTLGTHDTLDPELVTTVIGWFTTHAAAYRDAGMIAAPVAAATTDPQTRLLALFGRNRTDAAARAAIHRFGQAFDRRDVDAVMAAMTTDCVFESTSPPDGHRHTGQDEVRAAWTDFFTSAPNGVFETEELIVCNDRALARWHYTWATGDHGHVRGVDVFRVRDGLIAEKLSYVKG